MAQIGDKRSTLLPLTLAELLTKVKFPEDSTQIPPLKATSGYVRQTKIYGLHSSIEKEEEVYTGNRGNHLRLQCAGGLPYWVSQAKITTDQACAGRGCQEGSGGEDSSSEDCELGHCGKVGACLTYNASYEKAAKQILKSMLRR